jgi:dephospho-CoA kinase
MLIIGLTGLKRSGKDTVCQFILDEHPEARRFAFADALKEMLANATDVPVEQAEKDKERWRPVWQRVGTEIMRHYHGDDYWLRQLRLKLDQAKAEGVPIAIVTDVRFLNEAELFRELGGIVVRVERKRSLWQRFISLFSKSHRSESEMAQIAVDHTIDNYSDLLHLKLNTHRCMLFATCMKKASRVSEYHRDEYRRAINVAGLAPANGIHKFLNATCAK